MSWHACTSFHFKREKKGAQLTEGWIVGSGLQSKGWQEAGGTAGISAGGTQAALTSPGARDTPAPAPLPGGEK